MSFIKIENLTYTYAKGTPFEKTALKDINIEINKGEIIGIIGSTGSGKSTLIQNLNGLLKPTRGHIYIDDKDIWENKKAINANRFKVGVVFQYPEYQLFEETVYKDIAFGPKNMNLPKEEIHKRIIEKSKLVGISDEQMQMSPFQLSGGQKRRVAIAGVLAMEPEILILDEPAAGLDPRGRYEIFQMLKRYRSVNNATIIMISHSMEDIAELADKILVLNKSELYCFGTPDQVFSDSDDLKKIGLNTPHIMEVFNFLRKKGLNLPTNVFNVETAVAVVVDYLKRQKIAKTV